MRIEVLYSVLYGIDCGFSTRTVQYCCVSLKRMSVSGTPSIEELLNEDPDFLLWCLDISTDSLFDSLKPSSSSATSSSFSALSSTYSCSSLDAMDDLSGSGSEDENHSSSSHSNKRTKRYHDPLDDYLDKLLEG